MASGFFAVIATFSSRFDYAAIAIGVGLVCDGLDGKVARLLGSASDFGTQLDSLADVLAFGMAPAVLAFYWGVGPAFRSMNLHNTQIFEVAGWLACCTFVVCSAFRLARFNVSASAESAGFEGLPTPGAAAVIAAAAFAMPPLSGGKEAAIALALIVILSVLMVSRIRYDASGWIAARLRRPLWALPAALAAIAALWVDAGAAVLSAAVLFALSGPVAGAAASLRMGE